MDMSNNNHRVVETIKVLMLKGDKGDTGEVYDDTEIRELISSQNAKIQDLEDLVNSFDGTAIFEDFATLEEGNEATHEYDVGDYLVNQSQLYRVINAIAVHDNIVVGENVETTTVAIEFAKIAQKQFELFNQIVNKNTVITRNNSGDITSIVETTDDAVATTTLSVVTDGQGETTTLTTTIVPVKGAYNYVKTTVIAINAITIEIDERYTIAEKEVNNNE